SEVHQMNRCRRITAAAILLILGGAVGPGLALEPKDVVGKYTWRTPDPDTGFGEVDMNVEIALDAGKLKAIYKYQGNKIIGQGSVKGNTLVIRIKGPESLLHGKGEDEFELLKNGNLKGWWRYPGDSKKYPEVYKKKQK